MKYQEEVNIVGKLVAGRNNTQALKGTITVPANAKYNANAQGFTMDAYVRVDGTTISTDSPIISDRKSVV